MPYRQQYVPAPRNMKLTVYKELPKPFVEEEKDWLRGYRTARDSDYHMMYFCDHECKGWIEGHPNQYRVNTLEPTRLAGREGYEYYCLRCDEEIAFFGMMS